MRTGIKHIFLLPAFLALVFVSCKSKESASTTDKGHKLSPENQLKFQSTFYNACKEKINGNIELAGNMFKECLKIDPSSAPAQYELANIYRFARLYDEALVYAKQAAQEDPKNEWFQLLYIECLHNKKQYSEACSAYEKLIKVGSNVKPEFYLGLAEEYMYAGKPEKAAKTYADYEKIFGRDEEVAMKRVAILRQERKYSEAEQELKDLIRDFPEEPRYYTYLAEIYQDAGEPAKALEVYNESLKADPNNPFIHLALADYYRMQKQDSLFYKEIKIAFNSEDLGIDNKVRIMLSYYDMTEVYPKYLDEAYELLNIMKKVNPEDPKTWSIYGDFLYRDKKYQEAKEAYVKVLEYEKSKFEIWNQLFLCELYVSDYKSMLEHSTEAIDLFPNQPSPYFFNGVAKHAMKDYKGAIESYLDGLEFVYDNAPLQVKFMVNLGESYNADKQYEKSDKAFEEALSIDATDATVMNNYAYYLSLRKENLSRAEQLSARALEITPSSVSYMDTYAWILYQEGKYEDARAWLDKALQKGGDKRPAVLEHYGDVLYKLNDKDGALKYWQKAKEAGANSELLNKKITEGKLYE